MLPSIKGSVFAAAVEDVSKLIATATLSPVEAKRWLEPEDFALLDSLVSVASWYDIRSYDRMNQLLRDVEGGGSNDYLRDKGRQTAKRLLEAGLYAQLEYLHRTEFSRTTNAQERFKAFGRDLKKLSTLSASILSFSSWNARTDPEHAMRYRIEVSEAANMPETLAWRSDGFVNELAAQHDTPDLWSWSRPRHDLIVFRMKWEF
jgi:hypothetical protein